MVAINPTTLVITLNINYPKPHIKVRDCQIGLKSKIQALGYLQKTSSIQNIKS